MPTSIRVSDIAPRAWHGSTGVTTSELFKGASQKEHNRSKRVIQSSFNEEWLNSNHTSASNHGLVYTAFQAWNGHHHLVLRPEDIWFAILSQLNFYINAHAEELRSFFVAHQGQKELQVIDIGTIDTVDFGKLAVEMTYQIEKNVLDPELRTWIMPAFSTTTTSDHVVAAILMMGALQRYFSYTMHLMCGMPSVTLLGERGDWELLVKKLDKIPQLGKEPAHFAELLMPVLQRFVVSFDEPEEEQTRKFWSRIVHQTSGSGPHYLSGWITAFCFWKEDGKCLYHDTVERPTTWKAFAAQNAGCELDGVLYHRVNTKDIPSGYASVPVKVNDNGTIYETKMLAGLVATQGTSSGQRLDTNKGHESKTHYEEPEDGERKRVTYEHTKPEHATGEPGLDTLRPLSGWWMYEVERNEEAEKRKSEIEAKRKEMQLLQAEELVYPSEAFSKCLQLKIEIGKLEAF